MTSWRIFNCDRLRAVYPIRFAGTWKRYSNSAMDQLTSAATYHAFPRRSLKWAYHANVMNTFEQVSRPVVNNRTRMNTYSNAQRRTVPVSVASPMDRYS